MLASASAFQVPAAALGGRVLAAAIRGRAPRASVPATPSRRALALRMAAIKESPLDHAGARAVEEEERRINMWKLKFDLSDDQVAALRKSFEQVLATVQTDKRAVPTQAMKRVIETTQVRLFCICFFAVRLLRMHAAQDDPMRRPQVLVDSVDVGNDGRPAVTQDELQNYVKALAPLWAETCEQDAVEVANGECLVPLDTDNFDLSECMAVFGMCLREHCGMRACPPTSACLCARVFCGDAKALASALARLVWTCASYTTSAFALPGKVSARGGSLALVPRF